MFIRCEDDGCELHQKLEKGKVVEYARAAERHEQEPGKSPHGSKKVHGYWAIYGYDPHD